MERSVFEFGNEYVCRYFFDIDNQCDVKTTKELKNLVAEQIEALHPLNSSDEGAELYRQRFRGEPLYIKQVHEKEYKLLT